MNIVPAPQRMVRGEGAYVLAEMVTVSAPAGDALALLRDRLYNGAHITVADVPAESATPAQIRLKLDPALRVDEYRLRVNEDGVVIVGRDDHALRYGVVVLLQLLPAAIWRRAPLLALPLPVQFVDITDWPRFGWRGIMIDVARHFLPVREVLRIIELMAQHRFNRLHLHLADDQGWRLQISAFPRLTEVGAWRPGTQVGADDATAPENGRPHGGFYTADDIREIVTFASARGIVVVPEIDLPGHSQAAIAAYPELGIPGPDGQPPQVSVLNRWGLSDYPLNAEERTVEFFKRVLDEVMQLFPSESIGLGGDEIPADPWRNDERSRELARSRGLADPAMLQAWFIDQLSDYLTAHGRRMLAWDEVLEHSEHPNGVVLGWRGVTGVKEALRRGVPVIACPDDPLYFDYRQSDDPSEPIGVGVVVDLKSVYEFDPVPADTAPDRRNLVLGAQANLWSEHLDSPRSVDYMLWPRACALAEVVWSGPGGDFADFSARLSEHLLRLEAQGVEYRPLTGVPPWFSRPDARSRPITREERAAAVSRLTAGILR